LTSCASFFPQVLRSLGATHGSWVHGALSVTVIMLFWVAGAEGQTGVDHTAEAVLFESVSVVTSATGEVLDDRWVLTRNGRIDAIGEAGTFEVPSDALRIDGRGAYLVPGLVDWHARFPSASDPMRRVVVGEILQLHVAKGVTTLRVPDGAPYLIELKQQIARGEVLGPSLFVGSPSLFASRRDGAAALEVQARAYAEQGYDFLTVSPELAPELWEIVVEMGNDLDFTVSRWGGDPAGSWGMEDVRPIALEDLDAQFQRFRELRQPAQAWTDVGIESGHWSDLVQAALQADQPMVSNHVTRLHDYGWFDGLGGWVDPEEAAELQETAYVPVAQRDEWYNTHWNRWASGELTEEEAEAYFEWRSEVVRRLFLAGVPIVAGSGATSKYSVPGFAMHRELNSLVDVGMSRTDVLASATEVPARYLMRDLRSPDPFGAVAVGHRADLILLAESPFDSLETMQDPLGVVVSGRWLPREELEERLEVIHVRHRHVDTD